MGRRKETPAAPSHHRSAQRDQKVRRSDSEFSVRVAAEAALNRFYGAQENLPAVPDDIPPIKLEEELPTNSQGLGAG
jgi:hypothetical protein